MKIQGPNLAKLTAYHTQLQQQTDPKKKVSREDQLDISSTAKQLQETKKINTQRTEYVQEIKNAVESGQYKVDHEKVAQKMIDFWSKRL
jgi:negative regulator of flagellin synthesis FlgM